MLLASYQMATSLRISRMLSILRSGHCRISTFSSISTMISQLPCFGVYRLRQRRCPRAGSVPRARDTGCLPGRLELEYSGVRARREGYAAAVREKEDTETQIDRTMTGLRPGAPRLDAFVRNAWGATRPLWWPGNGPANSEGRAFRSVPPAPRLRGL